MQATISGLQEALSREQAAVRDAAAGRASLEVALAEQQGAIKAAEGVCVCVCQEAGSGEGEGALV
jgi:hypothetical protein